MICSTILALAMSMQAPSTGPKTDAELRAMMREINARVARQAAQRRRDNVRKATAELVSDMLTTPVDKAFAQAGKELEKP